MAYNFGPDGKVIPQSCYRGFERFSFGQKKRPSPFATARLAGVFRRFNDLADHIQEVDVRRLASSKGRMGKPVLPKGALVKVSNPRSERRADEKPEDPRLQARQQQS